MIFITTITGRYERMENTMYGKRREGRWTPGPIPIAGKLT